MTEKQSERDALETELSRLMDSTAKLIVSHRQAVRAFKAMKDDVEYFNVVWNNKQIPIEFLNNDAFLTAMQKAATEGIRGRIAAQLEAMRDTITKNKQRITELIFATE